MDRGAWWATVHGVAESGTTEHFTYIKQITTKDLLYITRSYTQDFVILRNPTDRGAWWAR